MVQWTASQKGGLRVVLVEEGIPSVSYCGGIVGSKVPIGCGTWIVDTGNLK